MFAGGYSGKSTEMKKSDGYLRLSLAAGFMALLPMSAHANLISNGTASPRTCTDPQLLHLRCAGDSTDIPGWTVSPIASI